MDYVFNLIDLPWWYFVIAIIAFLAAGLIWKKWWLGGLVGYLSLVISVTVLSREPFEGVHFRPELFWSYRVPRLREQIIMNVIAFIPVGVIGGVLWRWKSILFAAGLSFVVEMVQLVTQRGLMEFDDVIHNSLGALIGFGLFLIGERVVKRIIRSRDSHSVKSTP